MATQTPEQVADEAVIGFYGPQSHPELYALAVSDARGGEPTSADLLTAAAWYRDLDGHGVHKLMAAAVAADRARRVPALVVIAHRETWANDTEAEVLDVDNLLSFGGADYDPTEIAATVSRLRSHGWDSIADDVEAAEKERAR